MLSILLLTIDWTKEFLLCAAAILPGSNASPGEHLSLSRRHERTFNVRDLRSSLINYSLFLELEDQEALDASRIMRSKVPGEILRKRVFRLRDTAMLIVGLAPVNLKPPSRRRL